MASIKFRGPGMKLILHIAAWVIILGLPVYNLYRVGFPRQFVWGYYITVIVNGLIFYGNYLVLIPKLFFKERKLQYYLASTGLVISLFFIFMFISHLIFIRFQNDQPGQTRENRIVQQERGRRPELSRRPLRIPFGPMGVSTYMFNAIAFTVFAFGIRMIERNALIAKRQKELEKEKLNSELAFLKNQISPHFFFNTLNNIYSLIDINKEDSQNAVLKLSKMMRYLLYESEQGETRLSDEIDFMNNYIDLMRLRVSEKVRLSVSFPENHENIAIPPLLFISVIENAFKHGISYREKSFISITMEMTGNMINFICENSIVTKTENDNSVNAGIGLENLRKRLALLFPSRHELEIDRSQTAFRVTVRIQLI